MERIGLAPGSEIGGYTVVSPLGAGGMGTVYRAVDGGGSPVALKLLHPHVGADAAARARLMREVAALQRLRHPAVAAVLDAEVDSTEAFLVTELVDGQDLAARVHAAGPLGPEELADLAAGLRDALAAVHAAGVVHRDLKPSNVLLTDHGPVLIDFGIAQDAGDEHLTSTGLVMGTPGYLAPELLSGAEPGPGSDLWGWAAVLAFAATGRPPFGSGAVDVVLARARTGSADLADLGPVTAGALRRALEPDPQRRLAADDLVSALRTAAVDGGPVDGTATRVLSGADAAGTVAVPARVGAAGAGATVALAGRGTANDGRTRAFAPGGPGDGDDIRLDDGAEPEDDEPDDELHEPYDDGTDPRHPWRVRPVDVDEAVEWIEEDLDESTGPDEEGSGYVRPHARRRWGSVAALGLLVAAAGASWPGRTLIVVGALVLLVRAFGSTVEAMHGRREKHGVRPSDRLVAAVSSPWHLLRAVLGLVPSVLVAASVMVIGLGIGWWLVGTGRWTVGTSHQGGPLQGPTASVLVGLVVLAGVVLLWFGPLSAMTRLGARRALWVVTPNWLGALVLVLLALGVTAMLLVRVLDGGAIVWSPLPTPTLPSA
ncbi:MAG: serine/threonine protein kinase [Cellulomonas sp. 73-145]|uniref:serine/threonine-protein kinase n=1 Tax=Cellulomonas sp. 73-145 TaxID=1895739 RepID=UPI000928150A|nr:serine/threonine-protein kinase [Cellulomonas sp. 73-145]OJV57353.1 MAG: serine/threonine protein kinase [Cellulomonas sp. 73-145]